MKNKEKTPKSTAEMKLTVDYCKSFKEMIKAGEYYHKNRAITEKNFPIPGEMIGKKVDINRKLFHFNQPLSAAEAAERMDVKGFRSATLFELLALETSYPFPVVALGSVWASYFYEMVPCLDINKSGKLITLYWAKSTWAARHRFLAISKQ